VTAPDRARADALASLGLPQRDAEPVFAEPWQAQALALVVVLHRAGRFAWSEWVDALAAEIAARPALPGEDAGDAYYRQWLAALERIACARGLVAAEALAARAERWRRAYLRTPHGRPVRLENAEADAGAPVAHPE
jgi:nitrile hydratase accessory protein